MLRLRLALSGACLVIGLAGQAALAQPSDGLSEESRALRAKAQAGDGRAQFELGNAYNFGRGAPLDENQALRWYISAGNGGLADAQNGAGSVLMAQKKFADAAVWFEKAAAQNHLQAINSLAFLYDTGQGTPKDSARAFELYLRAANRGWAESMWNLANYYGSGAGVGKVDLVRACAWTLRAARYASDDNSTVHANVEKVMPIFGRLMNSEQKADCQKQGDEWKPPDLKEPAR